MNKLCRSLRTSSAALGLAAILVFGGGVASSQQYGSETQSPETLTRCLNSLFWVSRDVHIVREGESAVLLLDRIGWHTTWVAAADFDQSPPTVHDTFREDDPFSGVLFRQPMPWFIVLAFGMCGVEYEGQLLSSIDTWILEMEGFPSREPHDFPPPPRFYEVEDIKLILPPLQ